MKASSAKSKKIVAGGVDAYIAQFPVPIQTKLGTIRTAIQEVAPKAIEMVSYFGMPGYAYEGYDYNGMFAWFSYDGKNLRLHVRPPVLEDFSQHVKDYGKTKSIVTFSPQQVVPTELIKTLVKASIKVMTARA